MKLSLKHINTIVILGFVVLNAALFIWWGVIVNFNTQLDNALQSEYHKIELHKLHIDNELESVIDLFSNKADPISFTYGKDSISDENLTIELLRKIVKRNRLVHYCSLMDIEGNVVLAVDRDVYDENGILRVIREDEDIGSSDLTAFLISDPEVQVPLHKRLYMSTPKKKADHPQQFIHISVPLMNEEKVVGILYGEMNLNLVWELTDVENYQCKTMFIDSRGGLISSISDNKISREYGELKTNIPVVRQLISDSTITELNFSQEYENENGEVVYAVAEKIEPLHMMLVTEIPKSSIVSPIYNTIIKFSLIFLIVLFLMITLFRIIFKKFSASIASLSSMFKLSESGNYLLSEPNKQIKELQPLHTGYNKMVLEIKNREINLKESESGLKQAQSLSHIGSWKWNIEKDEAIWSDEMYNIYGVAKNEFNPTSENVIKTIFSEDAHKMENAIGELLEEKKTKPFEFRINRPNGEVRYLYVLALKEGKGVDGGVVFGVTQDITEIKKTEQELKESEEKYKEIFNSFTDVYYEADMDGRIELITPSIKNMSGYSADELIGTLIADKYKFQDQRNTLFNLLKEKETVSNFKAVMTSKNGTDVLLEANVNLRKNDLGENIGISGIVRNVTDREKLSNTILQLQEKNTMLKEIHHRVKNNLQVVTSLLSLQSSFIKEEEVKALFRYAQYRINTMSVVHEMLYQSDSLSNINYTEYLNKLLSGLIVSIKGIDNNITLNIEAPDVSLNIDTSIPLGLLINEIVTNSLKYGIKEDDKGVITVKLEQLEKPNFILEIGDDGEGFSDEITFKNTRSLGLKLIQKLVLQLKGAIEKDKSKKGTHYIISFQEIEQVS